MPIVVLLGGMESDSLAIRAAVPSSIFGAGSIRCLANDALLKA